MPDASGKDSCPPNNVIYKAFAANNKIGTNNAEIAIDASRIP